MMKAVVFDVSLTTSRRTDRRRRPFAQARMVAPAAPTPEASVGVAKPKKIDPSTATINPAGGSTAHNTPSTRRTLNGGESFGAGANFGST